MFEFNRSQLKEKSKEQIKGNLQVLFVCWLIVSFVSGLPSAMVDVSITIKNLVLAGFSINGTYPFAGGRANVNAGVFNPGIWGVLWFIAPALAIGLRFVCLRLIDGQKPQIKDVFEWLPRFLKPLWLEIAAMLLTILWALLLIIPGIIKAISYSMAPYIMADNPDISALEAINKSKELTHGSKMNLFVLMISFIGWWLLCVITFGIASIYVAPYYNVTMANAYRALKEKAEQQA